MNEVDELLRTPLYYAAEQGGAETVRLLLEHGALVAQDDVCLFYFLLCFLLTFLFLFSSFPFHFLSHE